MEEEHCFSGFFSFVFFSSSSCSTTPLEETKGGENEPVFSCSSAISSHLCSSIVRFPSPCAPNSQLTTPPRWFHLSTADLKCTMRTHQGDLFVPSAFAHQCLTIIELDQVDFLWRLLGARSGGTMRAREPPRPHRMHHRTRSPFVVDSQGGPLHFG